MGIVSALDTSKAEVDEVGGKDLSSSFHFLSWKEAFRMSARNQTNFLSLPDCLVEIVLHSHINWASC